MTTVRAVPSSPTTTTTTTISSITDTTTSPTTAASTGSTTPVTQQTLEESNNVEASTATSALTTDVPRQTEIVVRGPPAPLRQDLADPPKRARPAVSSQQQQQQQPQPKGRFSFVGLSYERARKAVEDLAKASQPGLSHKISLSRVPETPLPSPRSPLPPAVGYSTADSPSSRDSFSSAATSPREDLSDEQKLPRTAIGNANRPSEQDKTGKKGNNIASPTSQQQNSGKMHQTSSRLLRMTDDERPFTKDFMDLFSTLMVSLPLTAHRVRFQRVEHSFTSEEAINNLGSLKFSQSNRMPDPKDPSRIVTTTTTTTFSMAKEMARAVCQRFLEARFIEQADGKPQTTFPLKGPIWVLTPKGVAVLQRFCQRNGIQQRHVLDLIDSGRNTLNLVILERDVQNDKLSHDDATVEVIFRRFAGQTGPNIRSANDSSDPEFSDHYNGSNGIRQAAQRAIGNKLVRNTFTGKGVVDWLMDCTTIIDRRETAELADLFIQQGLMEAVVQDSLYMRDNPAAVRYQPTRSALYTFTAKGRWKAGHDKKVEGEDGEKVNGGAVVGPRESKTNNNRLNAIVNEPSLRLLFREYLTTTHCEENLSFYLEVREFTDSYDQAEKAKAFTRNDAIRENLAAAYGLYNAYLAPGSPNELNIDHNLRNGLASRMTRAVGDDASMLKSLQEVVALFKEAQSSVFKLMSSDSVPKFLKDPKFSKHLREQNFDQILEPRRDPSP